MARGLDHLIHLVRDLDAAGAAYAKAGFRVSGENRHPFGTKNRIVQFPGVFLEILAVGDHAPIPEHGRGTFSFAAFHRDRLARAGEGGSGLVLRSPDAKADAAAFAKSGIGAFEPFYFERRNIRADGSDAGVAFELAFASDSTSPDTAFFACEHKRPENFWSVEAMSHPNGATIVAGATLTAENPSDHHVFLRAFTGVDAFRATSLGLAIRTERGEIDVLTPEAFGRRTGERVPESAGMRLAAVRLAVADLESAEKRSGGLARRLGERALVIPASNLFGLTLMLEAADAA